MNAAPTHHGASRDRLLLLAWAVLVLLMTAKAAASVLLGPWWRDCIAIEPMRIDVNRASVGELQLLSGLGQVRAEAIVLDRIRHGPFRGLAELQRVDGLGPATIAEIAPFAVVADGDRAPPSR